MGKTWRVAATCALVAVAASIAQGSALAADSVDEGKALFDGRCKVCHKIERIVQISQRNPDADHGARWAKFLPSHAASVDAAGREAILAYLLATIAKP